MKKEYLIKLMSDHGFSLKSFRQENWEGNELDRQKSVFSYGKSFINANEFTFGLRLIIIENKQHRYPITLEFVKTEGYSEDTFERIFFEKIDTETELCESMSNIKGFIASLSEVKKEESKSEKFTKSKYLTYVYYASTGQVKASFDGLHSTELRFFLSDNGVMVNNFSVEAFDKFMKETVINDCFQMDKDSKVKIFAAKIFNPTESKGHAIKQMIEAENYLDTLIKQAKEFTENEDLVTADFVAQMNGENDSQNSEKDLYPNLYPTNILKGTGGIGHPAGVVRLKVEKDDFEGIEEHL